MTNFSKELIKPEPIVLKGGIAVDDRGFVRFVNSFDFKDVKRFYQVENHERGFIRAWHGHVKEAKYAYAVKGEFLVACMPLESTDATSVRKFFLTDKSPSIIYIPAGYYNGFKTLSEGGIIQFFSTSTIEESKGDDIRKPYDYLNTGTIWTSEYR